MSLKGRYNVTIMSLEGKDGKEGNFSVLGVFPGNLIIHLMYEFF